MTNEMKNLLSDAEVVLYRAGDTVKGTVIDVNPSRILVDLDGGVTGIITKKEAATFTTDDNAVQKGAELESVVIDEENSQGLVILSLRKASQDMVWAELNTLMEEESIITVRVEEANKGGLMAKYKGVRCFLPVSQLTPLNYPRVDGADSSAILAKLQSHIAKDFAVRVINVDRENGKVIISEKSAHAEQSQKTLKNMKVGDIVSGKVSGVVKYGIFVTFGGIEGLVHLSELDWAHVSDPAQRYSLGEEVQVVVIGIDERKLSFSIKQLTPDPWAEEVAGFEEGQKVSGNVTRWNSQGVFIEVKKNIQGFFPLEQFGVEDHSELKIKEGETMEGLITNIKYDSHRLELRKDGTATPKAKEAAAE